MKPGNDAQYSANTAAARRNSGFDTAAFYRSNHESGGVAGLNGAELGWQGGDIDAGETPVWTCLPAGPEDDVDNDFDVEFARRR